MEIVHLPAGEQAPPDSDCINLKHLAQGGIQLEAAALVDAGGEVTESVALLDGAAYDSIEAAEAAGTAWANDHGIARLYVSVDA